MRLHRLEIEGFGPFRERQTVDFDALARDGIFLIGGKTGAGKSSILDAVCFALYGGVPRYDEGEKRIRSDHAALHEPTRVRLEFTSGERRWAVERVPTYERLKRNGRGTTLTPAQALLEEWVDGGWVGRATRPVDVGHELGPVLGLNQHQFLQVILLAQGRFARFLLARNDERQALLRTLFDSQRFGTYEESLERRRKQTLERLALDNRTLLVTLEAAERLVRDHGVPDGLIDEPTLDGADEPGDVDGRADTGDLDIPVGERLARLRQECLRAAHLRELVSAEEATARDAYAAAAALHAARTESRREQIRRDDARAALLVLDARAAEIDASRALLADADAAELPRAPMSAADRADAALGHARDAHALSLTRWQDAGETVPGDSAQDRAALQARADELVAEVGLLSVAAAAERRLPALIEERDTAAALAATVRARLDQLDERRAALPGLIADASAAAADARVRASSLASAEAQLSAARAVQAAAVETRKCEDVKEAAERRCADTGRALTRASAILDELRDRRFRDHAGELAEALVDGEPCPVCGACEHPRPTSRGDAPVGDADIEIAEKRKQEAVAEDAAATAALQSARDALAAIAVTAGGRTRDAAEEAVRAAEAEIVSAHAAARERDRLDAERTTLETESAALDATYAELSEGARQMSDERAAVARSIDEATATVRDARGDHESVADRVAADETVIALARTLLGDLEALQVRSAAADVARSEFEAALSASPFADRAAGEAAMRQPAERERLGAEVAAHASRRAALAGTLLDLELQMLPEDPIDVDSAAAELARAGDARDDALRRSAAAERLARQLDDAVVAAEVAHEAVADLAEDATVIERLANAVAGRAPNTLKMNLETFVLAAELEEIVVAANLRLDEMTQGRYRLRHTDARAARGAASGLGIEVLDAFTGMARPVQSLSGGETFLASLALALGLAEVVTARAGGIALDTLFIDEGFGSLDADTLDIAMRTLDELRQGGRVVGVISHVEAMKDQLPAQVSVRTTSRGDSIIEQESSVTV